MIRSQPHRRRYFGQITFDSQPINWISRHRSFASRQWCESQIRYGEWTRDGSKRGYYLIYADVVEKIEPITVLIIIEYQETHVRILHIHVLRKKRWNNMHEPVERPWIVKFKRKSKPIRPHQKPPFRKFNGASFLIAESYSWGNVWSNGLSILQKHCENMVSFTFNASSVHPILKWLLGTYYCKPIFWIALAGVSRLVASSLFDTWVCGTHSRAAGPSVSTCRPSPDPKTGGDASSTASIDCLLGGILAKARLNSTAA